MEEYRNCPICFEVPEKEIYQCSSGHVICNVCIENLKQCPQCRVNYGATKVRSRVLEALLDTHKFECKFSDKGCNHLCTRNELSTHSNSCIFNPKSKAVPLCELLGLENCRFRINYQTRAEIIQHYKEKHGCTYHILPAGNTFDLEATKTRLRHSKKEQKIHWTWLQSLSTGETSPLFLLSAKVNSPSGFISFMCIQLWGSNERDKYKVELSLPNVLTTGTESGCKSSIKPFLFRWTLNAFTVSDAAWVLKTYPINVYIPVMMDNKLADKSKNTLSIDISLTC